MGSPTEFKKLCGYFFQEIGEAFSTDDEAIMFARRHLSRNEQVIVKNYMYEIVVGTLEPRILQEIWFASGAEIYFPDDVRLRRFLKLVRDSMQA